MTPKELLTQYALSLMGREYLWGGSGPYFDCSGFCSDLLRAAGIPPPHDCTAMQLFEVFKPQSEWGVIQWGSLIFFGQSTGNIKHIGFAMDGFYMLEAGGGDSSCTTIEISRKKGAFTRMTPIAARKDFCAALLPRYPFEVK